MSDDFDFLKDRDAPTVLVVDDNLVLVKLVIQTLTPRKLQCHWGRSVEEAKMVLQAYEVDLVITDIRRPFTDGIALARWIRQQPSISEIPILFFTSDSDRETISDAASIPDVDYLLKPLRPGQFCERVLKLIARQS